MYTEHPTAKRKTGLKSPLVPSKSDKLLLVSNLARFFKPTISNKSNAIVRRRVKLSFLVTWSSFHSFATNSRLQADTWSPSCRRKWTKKSHSWEKYEFLLVSRLSVSVLWIHAQKFTSWNLGWFPQFLLCAALHGSLSGNSRSFPVQEKYVDGALLYEEMQHANNLKSEGGADETPEIAFSVFVRHKNHGVFHLKTIIVGESRSNKTQYWSLHSSVDDNRNTSPCRQATTRKKTQGLQQKMPRPMFCRQTRRKRPRLNNLLRSGKQGYVCKTWVVLLPGSSQRSKGNVVIGMELSARDRPFRGVCSSSQPDSQRRRQRGQPEPRTLSTCPDCARRGTSHSSPQKWSERRQTPPNVPLRTEIHVYMPELPQPANNKQPTSTSSGVPYWSSDTVSYSSFKYGG